MGIGGFTGCEIDPGDGAERGGEGSRDVVETAALCRCF